MYTNTANVSTNHTQTPDIIKIASLPLNKDGHLLIVKPKGKEIWISLGGKIEEGETDEQCLRREIKEELNVEANADMKHFIDTPIEPAANEPDKTVLIRFYLLEVPDNLQPDNNEIEDYKWISRRDFDSMKTDRSLKIGSGLELYAIPKLIEEGLLK